MYLNVYADAVPVIHRCRRMLVLWFAPAGTILSELTPADSTLSYSFCDKRSPCPSSRSRTSPRSRCGQLARIKCASTNRKLYLVWCVLFQGWLLDADGIELEDNHVAKIILPNQRPTSPRIHIPRLWIRLSCGGRVGWLFRLRWKWICCVGCVDVSILSMVFVLTEIR